MSDRKHEHEPADAACIEALVLAAGEARRFGRAKQLLPWGAGQTILGHLLDTLRATPDLKLINLVLGARNREIAETLKNHLAGIEIIINPDWREGMFTSLAHGLSRIRDSGRRPRGIVVLLGDMPFIDPALLSRICRAGRATGDQAPVIAVESGRPAHPYLIRPHHIGEILSLSGESGIRPFIGKYFPQALKVEVDAVAGRRDIDTWEGYFHHRPPDSGPVTPPPPGPDNGLDGL